MTIQEKIEADYREAYKQQNQEKKEVLGLVKAKITKWTTEPKNVGQSVTDAVVVDIIGKQVKEHNDAISIYGSQDNINALAKLNKEKRQAAFLMVYLPQQLSNEELTSIIAEVKANMPDGQKLIGLVMKKLNAEHRGQFDGNEVKKMVELA